MPATDSDSAHEVKGKSSDTDAPNLTKSQRFRQGKRNSEQAWEKERGNSEEESNERGKGGNKR